MLACRYLFYRFARTINTSPFCVLSSEQYRVTHDRQQQRFTVRLDTGGREDLAVLKYCYRNDRQVDLLSTVVPESYRGKGVASYLAKAALDFVVEERLSAIISCWYIKKFVDENPHLGYQAHIENQMDEAL